MNNKGVNLVYGAKKFCSRVDCRLTSIVLFFSIVYCAISLVNHFLFRTYALDLGMFNQAIYSFSRFQNPVYTLDITGEDFEFFATHFSPIMYLYFPFYYLFGSYSLLLIQIFSILMGGVGIFRISQLSFGKRNLSYLILIFFYSCWGIYSALSSDFHNNVIGSMLLPWFIYFLKIRKRGLSLLFFILILMCQENMALWMFFVMAGLMFMPGILKRKEWIFPASLMLMSLLWFVVVVQAISPVLNHNSTGQLIRYSHLGGTLSEIMVHIVLHPVDAVKTLFVNLSGDEFYDGIKVELFLIVLTSGGVALLFRPQYLVMLIPVFAQKLLSNDYALWGINYQYSIEFVPVLSLAVIDFVTNIRNSETRKKIMVLFTFLTIISTISVTEKRRSKWYTKVNARFYGMAHYKTDIDQSEVRSYLKLIPDNIPISTSSELAPHLGRRKMLYHFPVVKDSEYIVLFKKNRSTYPLSEEEYLKLIISLKESGDYLIKGETDDIIILKRNPI